MRRPSATQLTQPTSPSANSVSYCQLGPPLNLEPPLLSLRSALFVVFLLALLAPNLASALAIIDPGQGPVALADDAGVSPRELSGVTWVPGTSEFLAVSDDQPRVYRLSVGIDPVTGEITNATTVSSLALTQSNGTPFPVTRDIEGVALGAGGTSVFVSDERGPTLREHSLTTGRTLAEAGPTSAPALAVFANQRTNLGWESLTRAPDTGVLWTANEEALSVDSPSGASVTNKLIRLQQLAPDLTPTSQWAYRVSGGTVPGTLGNTNDGVSDLVALPGGQLLVLERSAGLISYPDIDLRNRIYLVDFSGASDVTAVSSLASAGVNFVSKTLLWEGIFPDDNFEGIALGPTLANGDRNLLLVSDDGAGLNQSLYALRLVGVPEPASFLLLAAGLAAVGAQRHRVLS